MQRSLIVFLLLTGCALLGQKKIIEPKLELAGVSLASADFTGAKLLFDVKVDNPNNFPLELDSVNYALDFQGKPVGQGEITENLKVEKNGTAIIRLPVQVQLGNLAGAIGSLLGAGTTPYHIKGGAKLGFISLPFEESGDLRFENGKVRRIKAKKD